MFKARGTRIVMDDRRGVLPPVVPPVVDKRPDIPTTEPRETTAIDAAADADIGAVIGMGLPILPTDFRDRLLAAQAGDIDSIVLMRRIGEQVPKHMQMAFSEMVHDILNGG